jgi:hypothetical protein
MGLLNFRTLHEDICVAPTYVCHVVATEHRKLKMYETVVTSHGIKFIQNFVKIGQLKGTTDRQHDILVSLPLFTF